mgnify:CR=1 FL=1
MFGRFELLYLVRVALLLTTLLLSVLLVTGCARKERAQQTPKKEIASNEKTVREVSDGAEGSKEQNELDLPFPKVVKSSALLSHRLQRRILPEDPMIGPLADSLHTTVRDQSPLHTTRLFLTAIVNKDLANAPFSAYGQRHLTGTMSYHLKRGLSVTRFRIGNVEQADDTAYVQARLFSHLGSIIADIYLILSDNNWLIDDIQTDWAKLKVVQPKPKPIPLPRSDGWVYF